LQQASAGIYHATTRLVVLDVVVTDRKGNLIDRPLTRDDFNVVEDGQVQTIRDFEPPTAHRMPVATAAVVHSAADLAKIGDAPVTILVLDELNSAFVDMSYGRQMLVKYLETQPPVLKQPTALMVAENATFQQLHDYTQDRDALIAIVKHHMPGIPTKLAVNGPAAVERIAQTMAALQQLAESSMGTPGRKNVIWVGNGFPSVGLVGLSTPEAEQLEAAFRRITVRLMAARITMYTIDPMAGSSATVLLETPDDLAASLDSAGTSPLDKGSVSFAELAPATGGIAYTGRNDLNNVIGEGIDKGQNYYTLTYTPTSSSEDAAAYRNIKVVMKDPTLVATTRNGYYPETVADMNPVLDQTMKQKQVMANLELDLSAALTSTISYNGLGITAQRTAPGAYSIHVAPEGIGWLDSAAGQHQEVTLAAAWYDSRGKILGHTISELLCQRLAKSTGAVYQVQVSPPPGTARLRFAVRDASNGRMGTIDITKF
jgi:VWFA-related protein